MQDIDHNMDELLRRAADHYPLKINDGNWDAVAAQLNAAPVAAPKKNKVGKYGLSILLLLLSLSLFLFTSDTVKKTTGTNIHAAYSPASNIQSQRKSATDQPVIYPASVKPIKSEFQNSSTTHQPSQDASGTVNIPGTDPFARNATRFPHITNNLIATYSSAAKADEQSSASTSNPRKRRAHFYIGLATGPEFNQIKNQGLQKTGFDVGFIAGYQATRKLSLETGLFFSRKYYFTDGKYFNMDMPGMKVVSLDGSCTVLEIPLKLKYDIINRNKMSLFSSAGISSYMLLNEKNNYLLTQINGTQQSMVASYDERCRYFAATVDLSIGYQHTLGKSTNLRIEPYLQLPLKGIGVGTMPVKSAGMHIGVTRSIF